MIPEREKRIAKAIHKILLNLMLYEVKNPIIKNRVEITKVELSKDLKIADIYIHIKLQDSEDFINVKKRLFKELRKSRSYFRKRIAESINIKYCPEIRFQIDTGYAKGLKVLKILDQLKEDQTLRNINNNKESN